MSADDLYGNGARTLAYNWDYLVRRLNEPVDRLEWRFRPYTVNASYNPGRNDITFPAGILQPPLFDPVADPAINYGGIGSVIGHEITHGFDDQGRKSDGDGVLTNWWTQEDGANFKSRAGLLASQYDAFEVVKGNFVNGQLTIGENIADLGGILLALDAYHASLHGKEPPVLDGLTGDQRFFLGVAQVWRTKVRDAAAIASIKTDVHSPAQFRVNGPLRNIAAWYEAFKIAPGDPMYLAPEKRVRIW
jgi:putative endopeptidase